MKAAIACLVLLLALPASADQKDARKASRTLYERLGGDNGVPAVVSDLIGRAASDDRIKTFFMPAVQDPARLNLFKQRVVEEVCSATGGPCKYTGKNMKAAHAGMHITNKDFDAFVDDLKASLTKFKVKDADQRDLLAILEPMRKDIVTAHARDTASK